MNKRGKGEPITIEEALEKATAEQLCAALKNFGLDPDQLDDMLEIGIKSACDEAREEGKPEGKDEAETEALDALDTEWLCDAIAEGRTRDALDILHEAQLTSLHPRTIMRLAELRRTA